MFLSILFIRQRAPVGDGFIDGRFMDECFGGCFGAVPSGFSVVVFDDVGFPDKRTGEAI